jgi:hypothetical protein
MPHEHPTEKDKIYIKRIYPTRYHALAFIIALVIAGILSFIFAYFWRIVIPDLVPVHICAGIMFLCLAFYIRYDYESRGFRLFPKKKYR